MCVLALLCVAWLCFAIPKAWSMASQQKLRRLTVELTDPASVFVNAADIVLESGIDQDSLPVTLRSDFDLYALRRRLEASDKIENVQVNILTDGTVRIIATPMVPVARVFDTGSRDSYYINSAGKHIRAELRYHIDVPVVTGHFDSRHPARELLPLLNYIAADRRASAMVAGIFQEPDGNIILVPSIVGHVVNFGDTTLIDNKFRRLRSFYHQVSPTAGWDRYDTIAVKWRGKIFATRTDKTIELPPVPTLLEQEGTLDINDDETTTLPDSLSLQN